MTWIRRILLASPFVIAAVLTALMFVEDRLHQALNYYVAVAYFLFVIPWAWLLDHIGHTNLQSPWAEKLSVYIFMLWIPACLYYGCLWLLFRAFGSSDKS